MTFKVQQANSPELRQKAFDIRKEVFVDEQNVAEGEEFDKFEESSIHFVALNENNQPIGASRWRTTNKGIKLERFAVKKSMRGKGVGRALVETTLQDVIAKTSPGTYVYMHSQLDAVPLYEKFGFQIEGDQFDECGILHYLMWKRLSIIS